MREQKKEMERNKKKLIEKGTSREMERKKKMVGEKETKM